MKKLMYRMSAVMLSFAMGFTLLPGTANAADQSDSEDSSSTWSVLQDDPGVNFDDADSDEYDWTDDDSDSYDDSDWDDDDTSYSLSVKVEDDYGQLSGGYIYTDENEENKNNSRLFFDGLVSGDEITLYAEPWEDYEFYGWYDYDLNEYVSEDPVYTITMEDSDRTFSADFTYIGEDSYDDEDVDDSPYFGVWAETDQNELYAGGTVSFDNENWKSYLSGSFEIGDQVTLYAQPDEGYLFVGWFDDTTDWEFVDGAFSYTFTVYSDEMYIDAVFHKDSDPQEDDNTGKHYISVRAIDDEMNEFKGGRVSTDNEGWMREEEFYVSDGEQVTLYAKPDEGYEFAGWYNDTEGYVLITDELSCTITVEKDLTIAAEFDKIEASDDDISYSLTVDVEDDYGQLSGGYIYTDENEENKNNSCIYFGGLVSGDEITLYAEPWEDYRFVGWYDYDADGYVSEDPVYTVTMEDSDRTFSADFTYIGEDSDDDEEQSDEETTDPSQDKETTYVDLWPYEESDFKTGNATHFGTVGSVSFDNENWFSRGTCVSGFVLGDQVTFYAKPKTGYKFVGWYKLSNSKFLSDELACTITIDQDYLDWGGDIAAVFAEDNTIADDKEEKDDTTTDSEKKDDTTTDSEKKDDTTITDNTKANGTETAAATETSTETAKKTAETTETTSNTPKTGDSGSLALWISMLLLLGAALMTGNCVFRFRRNR